MRYICIKSFEFEYKYRMKIKIGILKSKGNKRLGKKGQPFVRWSRQGFLDNWSYLSLPFYLFLCLLLSEVEACVHLYLRPCVSPLCVVAVWSPQSVAQVEFTAQSVGFTLTLPAYLIWRAHLFQFLFLGGSWHRWEQIALFFLNLCILFTYFWLHWVFVAVRGLSLVAASGSYSSLWRAGFSSWWPHLLWSTGSRLTGFSSCGTRAQ